MTGSAARVAHMRNWVDQLELDIARLVVQRDALWQAIAVLDPDALSSTVQPTAKVWPTPAEVGAMLDGAGVTSPALVAATKPKTRGSGKKAANRKPAKAKVAQPEFSPSSIGVSRGRPPLEEIAAVYNAAKADKKATGQAMADHFGVHITTTYNWPRLLAQAGLINDRKPGRPSGAPNKPKPTDAQVTQISSAKSAVPRRDWGEVAARIVEFRDQGVSVQEAISKLYKVPSSTAKQWMKHCRETGLVKPLVANLRVVEDNTRNTATPAVFDGPAVAEAYLAACRDGRRPMAVVEATFDVDRDVAKEWVALCRSVGQLAPAGAPQLPEAERRALLEMSKPEPVA